VLRPRERGVHARLVLDHTAGLETAARRDQERGAGVVDPHRELVRREAAEDDHVHGAQPRAGEHGDYGFGHHRQVDDDAVALADPQVAERPRERRHLVAQLGIRVAAPDVRHGGIVRERNLLAAAAVDVAVERQMAGVQDPARVPSFEPVVILAEDLARLREPLDQVHLLAPEEAGVRDGELVDVLVAHRRSFSGRARAGGATAGPRGGDSRPPGTGAMLSGDVGRSTGRLYA